MKTPDLVLEFRDGTRVNIFNDQLPTMGFFGEYWFQVDLDPFYKAPPQNEVLTARGQEIPIPHQVVEGMSTIRTEIDCNPHAEDDAEFYSWRDLGDETE